jgi:hypothetical protein
MYLTWYDIYLLELGFHPMAAFRKLRKETAQKYKNSFLKEMCAFLFLKLVYYYAGKEVNILSWAGPLQNAWDIRLETFTRKSVTTRRIVTPVGSKYIPKYILDRRFMRILSLWWGVRWYMRISSVWMVVCYVYCFMWQWCYIAGQQDQKINKSL